MQVRLATAVAVCAILATAAPAAAEAPDCPHDREALLALDVVAFDHTLNAGWRPLADVAGCEGVAADLIAEYRKRHEARLRPDQRLGLAWHEAQLRAATGDYARAIPLFEAALPARERNEDRWFYGQATLAFLRGDRARLEAVRAEYARLPKPDWFDKEAERIKAQEGADLAWPMNLHIVDGLIRCFGRPYREAYAGCRAADG